MTLVSPVKVPWRRPVKSVALKERQSLSPADVVSLEEGSLSLERGSPWATFLFDREDPLEAARL